MTNIYPVIETKKKKIDEHEHIQCMNLANQSMKLINILIAVITILKLVLNRMAQMKIEKTNKPIGIYLNF